MSVKKLHRNFFQRLLGKPASALPKDPACWTYAGGVITVDLKRATELSERSGALRLEGNNLPKRVLVFRGEDDQYYAVCNQCTHGGRRVDPDPETGCLQCCSVNKSGYAYDGNKKSGPAKAGLTAYEVREENGALLVTLS